MKHPKCRLFVPVSVTYFRKRVAIVPGTYSCAFLAGGDIVYALNAIATPQCTVYTFGEGSFVIFPNSFGVRNLLWGSIISIATVLEVTVHWAFLQGGEYI